MNSRRVACVIAAVCVIALPVVFVCLQLFGSRAAEEANPEINSGRQIPSTAGAAVHDVAQATTVDQPDAVIVGAGISGLSAALELGRAGANVTVIDMSSVFGGHAVMSQGGVSIVGTPVQETEGFEDSPELAYQDFMNWGEDADADWVRYYTENSRQEIYDWLIEIGVQFEGVELSPGNTVPRFHQPIGRGIGLVTPIFRECLELENISFVWNTQAEKLLTENGRIAGVMTRNLRTEIERPFRAAAVILATGGFQSNLEMVRQYWPEELRFPERILIGSGLNSVGHGHKLAQSVGADLVKMDHQWNYFTGIPDPRLSGSERGLNAANMYAIVVNSEGRRFTNLLNWAKEVMPALLKQKQATLWFIFDEASKPNFVVSGSDWADFNKVEKLILNNPQLVASADTIQELAAKAGLPPPNLVETIRRYNTLVEQGQDQDFGRFGPEQPTAEPMSPKIETPPFYAMQTFPLTRKSMGGVAIDLNCRVLDKNRQPIPGLYAVGELTGLAGINGKAALEGTFLGPCIVTGRVAARSVLEELGVARGETTVDVASCSTCHDMESLLADSRSGYWHFEKVHGKILERRIDCRQCHAELAPYRLEGHHINHQALAASCVRCHVAQE